MINKINTGLLLSMLGAIFYVVFFYDVSLYQPLPKPDDIPDFQFESLTVSHINNGVVELELQAENAVIYRGSHDVRLEGVTGAFYFGEGDNVLFESPYSQYDLNNREMVLENAYMVLDKGDDLIWMDSNQIRLSPDQAEIVAEGDVHLFLNTLMVSASRIYFPVVEQRIIFDQSPEIAIDLSND